MNYKVTPDSLSGPTKLIELREGEAATIVSVPEVPLLGPLGIRPRKRIKLQARQRFGGPLVVELNGRGVAVPREIAAEIRLGGSHAGG